MKKTLALILTLVMLLSCLSVTALATGSYELGDTALYFRACTADTEPSNDKLVENYKAFIIDHAFEGVEDFVESNVSAIIAGTATGYVGKFNLLTYYSDGLEQYAIASSQYNGDATAVPGNTDTAICVVFYYANGFESDPTHYEAIGFVTVDKYFDDAGSAAHTGWKELSAEAPEEDGKSGTTTLTATKAEPFRYEIVFPTSVEPITAAGVYEVGQAKVKDVVSATEKTVISYTATTTDFKLSTDESTTLAATYHSDAEGTTAFPTTAVKVYENKANVASIPTMYVKIADADWNAAAAGTYTATVTFNFEAEEVEAKTVSVAEALVVGAQYNLKFHYMLNDYSATYTKTADGFELSELLQGETDSTAYYSEMLSSTVEGSKIKFVLGEAIIITVDTSTNKYEISGLYPQNVTFTSFSVKPAGETEFTEITLTAAE